MSTQVQTSVLNLLEERHSVRDYEVGHKLPKADLEKLLTTAATAPSAWNLQHWKLLVIEDEAQKEKLLPIAYGQQQITQSSVVIAVLGDLEANKNAEIVHGAAVAAGMMPKELKDGMAAQIEAAYQDPQTARDSAYSNAGLISMQLMITAKAMGYDTCPMGGFDKTQFVEAFNVPARYAPVMLVTVGLATKPGHPSNRLALDQFTVSNSF